MGKERMDDDYPGTDSASSNDLGRRGFAWTPELSVAEPKGPRNVRDASREADGAPRGNKNFKLMLVIGAGVREAVGDM